MDSKTDRVVLLCLSFFVRFLFFSSVISVSLSDFSVCLLFSSAMSTDFHNDIADMTIASIVKPEVGLYGLCKMLLWRKLAAEKAVINIYVFFMLLNYC